MGGIFVGFFYFGLACILGPFPFFFSFLFFFFFFFFCLWVELS